MSVSIVVGNTGPAHIAGTSTRPVYDYAIRAWLAGFLDCWLATGQQRLAAAE